MESKRFTKNDNGFICENCGARVEPLGYSSRNHCPFCLCSKHVDVMPGDRANQCGGIMDPIRVELDSRKGYVIIHKCRKCGEIKRNKAATEAKNQPDDIKKIIKLTAGEIQPMECMLCPRRCGVDRSVTKGFCHMGDKIKIAKTKLKL